MQLAVSSIYQPNEDEVWVEFRSTLDDLTTVTVPDTLTLTLMIEVTDSVGNNTYLPISTLTLDASFVRPDQNFEITFRNPPRKMDLYMQAHAVFNGITYVKMVSVGEALASHNSMQLPDNVLYSRDTLTEIGTGGDEYFFEPNENVVILAPELADYETIYDFTIPSPAEDFGGLTYQGGGSRLMIQNQTGQFELQTLDQAPWIISSYLFLENGIENLIPNSFFLTSALQAGGLTSPQGFQVNQIASTTQSFVEFNYQISAAAKLWTLLFNQQNQGMGFKEAVVSLTNPISCQENTTYTFSVYTKIAELTSDTKVTKLTLKLTWMHGVEVLGVSDVILNPADFSDLSIASLTATAPANTTTVVPVLSLGSIDAGDQVQLSLLGFQLEPGSYATSRTLGTRTSDELIVEEYNAENQMIRMQFVAGFTSTDQDQILASGPLIVSFLSSGHFEVEIPGQGTLTVPLTFEPGDPLDLTIQHQSGKTLAVLRDGQLLADTPLQEFTATPAPLTIFGVGVELMKLSVFSRRSD